MTYAAYDEYTKDECRLVGCSVNHSFNENHQNINENHEHLNIFYI